MGGPVAPLGAAVERGGDDHFDIVTMCRDRLVGGRAIVRAVGHHLGNLTLDLIGQ